MTQRNCKNCNAPIQHSYNHRCEYCGTLYDFNEPKEETIEFNSMDMINVKYRGCEIDHPRNILIMKFEGIVLQKPKIYECYSENIFVSKVENYINPPKSFFCIELSINELERAGFNYLGYVLHNYIRYSEISKVINQINQDKEMPYLLSRCVSI